MIRIVINDIPPSNNKYQGKTRHHGEYQEEKKLWYWIVKAAIKERPKEPIKRALVTITYYFKDERGRDPDNYSGKFLLDPLVKEKIIADDNMNVIDLYIKKGGADKDNPRVEIEITEMSSGL